ncbi:glycosyltransferase [Priestia megaterium]
MKFCSTVVLYYPTQEELEVINRYRQIFEHVYIYDNTDNEQRKVNEEYFFNLDNTTYISDSQNNGLSKAFNVVCRMATSKGFSYICLFDQDSLIENKDLQKMMAYINRDNNKEVAVYAPEIIYSHETNVQDIREDLPHGKEVEWAITSGSFISLSIYERTEGFDENYFIDRLDYDYCYTVRKMGYKVIKICNTFLFQTLGEQNKKGFSNHSPIRHYYIFRNRLFFYKKMNPQSLQIKLKAFLLSLRHIGRLIRFEDNKWKKIRMSMKGLSDYKRKRMGKY